MKAKKKNESKHNKQVMKLCALLKRHGNLGIVLKGKDEDGDECVRHRMFYFTPELKLKYSYRVHPPKLCCQWYDYDAPENCCWFDEEKHKTPGQAFQAMFDYDGSDAANTEIDHNEFRFWKQRFRIVKVTKDISFTKPIPRKDWEVKLK